MENKSCESCLFHTDSTLCTKHDCCVPKKHSYIHWQPIPTPNKMIEVEGFSQVLDYDTENGHESRKNNVKIMIDPSTQPAIQSYLAQEIARQDLIPRKDAVKYVEIDRDKLWKIIFNSPKDKETHITVMDNTKTVDDIILFNPLKLKQRGSDERNNGNGRE